MRKLTVLFAAVLFCNLAAKAQKGVEIGVAFTPMSTWIINDNDFEVGKDLNLRGTFGFLTGITAGYNITDGFGIQTGFMINKCGQNYATDYDGITKADQDVFSRKLTYMRVPVLFKLNGNMESGSGMYFRVGPHFDILSGAKYTYTKNGTGFNNLIGSSFEDKLKDFTGLDPDAATYPLTTATREYEMYKNLVVGATLEMGGFVKLGDSDNMKLVFLLHLEGSLTNPEGKDSPYYYNGITYLYPANTVGVARERATAWNLAGGLTVGFNYVIPVE